MNRPGFECSDTEALKMVYDSDGNNSGCIDSENTEAGDIVMVDGRRWRVTRTTRKYIEVYRRYGTEQILEWDDVEPVPRPDGEDDVNAFREFRNVDYVEYDGDGYRVFDVIGPDKLEIDQPLELPIEVPADECTPTDEWGTSLDDGSDDDEKRLVTDGGRPRKVVVHCDYCTAGMSVKRDKRKPDQGWKCKQCWEAEQAGTNTREIIEITENADGEPGDRVEYDGREWVFVDYCIEYYATLVPVGLVATEETVTRMVDVRELEPVKDRGDDSYAEYDPERHARLMLSAATPPVFADSSDDEDPDPKIVTDGGVGIDDFDGVDIDGAGEDEKLEEVTEELLDEMDDFDGEEIDEDGDLVSDNEDDSEDDEEPRSDDVEGENVEDTDDAEDSEEDGEDEDEVSTTPIAELGEHMSPADMWSNAGSYYKKNATDPAPRRAREMVAGALMAEMDWLCVRESSEPGNYDLRVYVSSRGCYVECGSTILSERMTQVLGGDSTPAEVNHVTHLVANNCMVDEDDLDAADRDETLIPLENGVLVLESVEFDPETGTIDPETGELLDKSPEFNMTFGLPVAWDPDGADLELVNEWMGSLTGFDDVDSRTIWEFGGHALLPEMEPQAFLIVIAGGGNGKTTMFNVFIEALAEENTTSIPLQKITDNKFSSYRMCNRLANLNPDISGSTISDVSALKSSTGNDLMEVERKGIDPYDARSTAAQIMGANSPPSITEKTYAVKRRLHPVVLESTFKPDPDPDNPFEHKKDPDLKDKLTTEAGLSAVIFKFVEGARRLQHQHEFTLAQKYGPHERLTLYESHADPVADFERACLERDPNGNGVAKEDIKACYDAFALDKDHPEKDHDTLMRVLRNRQTTVLRPSTPRSWTDDDGRTPIYKGMKFAEKAKENWLPEDAHWSQYGGRPDDTGDTVNEDAENGVTHTPIDEVRSLDPGRYEDVGVRVEVAHELDARPWLHYEAVVKDESNTMRVQSLGEHTLDEGETYVISDVTVIPTDADKQIQLVPAQTDVTLIDTGSDQTGLHDDDDEVEDEEDAPTSESDETKQDAARADEECDAGEAKHIDRAAVQHANDVETVGALAGRVSAATQINDLDRIKHRIETLRQSGDIILREETDKVGDEVLETIDAMEDPGDGEGVRSSKVIDRVKDRVEVDSDSVKRAMDRLFYEDEICQPSVPYVALVENGGKA